MQFYARSSSLGTLNLIFANWSERISRKNLKNGPLSTIIYHRQFDICDH